MLDVSSYETNEQPGRRLATGSTRGDHIRAAHGFFAHLFLFWAVGIFAWLCSHGELERLVDFSVDNFELTFWLPFILSQILLIIRAKQVGFTTTFESVSALWTAWIDDSYADL